MTPEHIQLVQSTVPVLRENGVALTSYFYQRMLKNHPELKNTFNLDHQRTGRQPRALAAAVLAYAEHIENPSVLAKAVDHMTTKHVSLDIQPDQYAIVGENLLHSISEVLDVPMDSELIAAWKEAYTQLANLLISVEKTKYDHLSHQNGGWAGWREFVIEQITATDTGKRFTLIAKDQQAIAAAEAGQSISVRVKVPHQDLHQPLQFKLIEISNQNYCFDVKSETDPSEFSVTNILIHDYHVGDVVEVSAPIKM
ncbi:MULTISPECIES: globin domain-containing protein [unclassified Acinetobacter]|uniref:globin domain-containing protein n=1 Tax=unclassified Acinetobacter TaxID=196816 RepID=UPI0029342770|nr:MULTISPECIES: globin domain-containing protein [unclassified Acinetobacter]WOE31154.1 globin domain-containing protein [Acinetobacter sp. SAAs470]WOE39350.1 globin domain-containing protein [Acinetobacter sp. SAAs474]